MRLFFTFIFICDSGHVHVSMNVEKFGGQVTTVYSQFSPYSFLWVPETQFWSHCGTDVLPAEPSLQHQFWFLGGAFSSVLSFQWFGVFSFSFSDLMSFHFVCIVYCSEVSVSLFLHQRG